jgi:cysteine desulfurase
VRECIAGAIGAAHNEVYFTSGGTESVNWAVLGSIPNHFSDGKHIITSLTEHSAVLESVKAKEQTGFDVTYLKPDHNGRILPRDFAAALRDDTIFSSIMLVNNEIGSINPIKEYVAEVKRRKLKTIIHCDAVQGFAKIPINVKSLGVDLLSFSAHKIHGPKGVGVLYIKDGTKIKSTVFGGVQEDKRRPGTEALPNIAGFGVATSIAIGSFAETAIKVEKLRNYIIEKLKTILPEIVVIGSGDSPFILNISLPGYKSEVLMNFLDNEGICVTKGSACRKGLRSRVLEAMGLRNDIIDGAIRISFSRYNTIDEADYFIDSFYKASKSVLK